MVVRADLSQLTALSRDLQRAPAHVVTSMRVLVDHTAERIAQQARQRAPRGETGNLRASIVVKETGPLSRAVTAGARNTSPNAFYAGFVEYGTAHMAAQPFLNPVVDTEEPAFYDRVRAIRFGVDD